jgi:two-component system sensor histidine kinase BaeS
VRPTGLRARLALAFVLVAVLAVATATVFANLGLDPRLNSAARARLNRSAGHAAGFAAGVYAGSPAGWSPAARGTLAHLAALDGLRLAIVTPDGRRLSVGPPPTGATARAPVIVRGRRVGTVVIAAAGGSLLTPEERHLRHSLDLLHLAAAAAATVLALLVAWLLAATLARPLRRIRATAERLERGDVAARVTPGGGDEVRAVGRALNRLAETLQREDQLRRAGVADLAHELRTPVNGLLSRIEAAQDGVLTGPDNLAAMHDEALRLTRLLDDLSRLSDAEQPGLLLDKQPLDLATVVAASADSFLQRFAEAGVRLDVDLAPVIVVGDAGRLEQVAANLLSNALRYTDAGGSVQIAVAQLGDEALLEVADTGIGIAPEDLRHVFTRFWRSDRSRSRETGGTGIGLAIVSELVRAHDGRIDLDSTPGHGSRFRVWLPIAAAS